MSTTHLITRRQFALGAAGIAALGFGRSVRLLTFPAGAATDRYVVTSGPLRLRAGPGLGYRIIDSLPTGATVEVVAWDGKADGYSWAKVYVPARGETGYVASDFLAPSGSSSGSSTFPIGSTVHVDTATGGNANMRSGAGLSYGVIAVIRNGATGTVQSGETAADGYRWIKVTMQGTTGWMATVVLSGGAGTGTTPPPSGGDTTEEFPIGATVHVDTTSGGNANLRSGPGLSYAVIKILPNGTTATILSAKTMADGYAWVKIAILGTEGWMANGCLSAGAGSGDDEPPSDADIKVADGPLNVRETPGMTGKIITSVPTGATGDVLDGPTTSDGLDWVKVRFFNQYNTTGWVAEKYLTWL
jgi:uncharacterized protein YraI